MGELQNMAISGAACSKCLAPFQDEELEPAIVGAPAVCQHCWDLLEDEEKKFM